MKINSRMNLGHLAERMGADATADDAYQMREMLVHLGTWECTEDVPETEWLKLLDAAVDQAQRDHATLESEFADAIGHDTYQRLLNEQWLPFQAHWHLSMRPEDAIAREVANAREFLASLDLDDDKPTI